MYYIPTFSLKDARAEIAKCGQENCKLLSCNLEYIIILLCFTKELSHTLEDMDVKLLIAGVYNNADCQRLERAYTTLIKFIAVRST